MEKLRILHLEDNVNDAFFVRKTFEQNGVEAEITHVTSHDDFISAINQKSPDIILSDNGLPGFNSISALKLAREKCPGIPFIIVSGSADEKLVQASLQAGASDFVIKTELWQLLPIIRRIQTDAGNKSTGTPANHHRAMSRLVNAVQELSLARNLETVMSIVRIAARELTGADGATFVLREGDKCFYADENAISPLWKGQRFPMSACISGWAMLNKQSAVIEDIYTDSRIPADAYRPTFVKSLVMVPIRTDAPIGAIGNYWAQPHRATASEVELLQALANTTAVAMENIQLYMELEQRVQERTLQLEAANNELEAFSYSVSHDLRAPLRSISGFANLLKEDNQHILDSQSNHWLDQIKTETHKMSGLIEDLLRLAKFTRINLKIETVNLGDIAKEMLSRFKAVNTGRRTEFLIESGLTVRGDAGLLKIVLENLLSNAWKYTSKQDYTRIEFGTVTLADGNMAYFVRDNGVGFDMEHARNLFTPFQRLHTEQDFAGTGVGLATVQRIIHRHGGRIWPESAVGEGATFFFTLSQNL